MVKPFITLTSSRATGLILLTLLVLVCTDLASARRGAEVGSDCLQPISRQTSVPIFGACGRRVSAKGGRKSTAKPTPFQIPQWIILWKEIDSAYQLSQEVCLKASDPASEFQGQCTSTYHNVIQAVSIKLSEAHLIKLLAYYGKDVSSVHEDTGVVASDIQPLPTWSLDRLDQAFLPLDQQFIYYNLATGVNVYIIDTGIQVSHDEFRYPNGQPGSRASEAYSSLTSGAVGQDCNGHGTHVAGTVGGLTYGPAKNASLYAIRSLECLGNGTITQVIDGLDWLSAFHIPPAVAVLALGGDAQYALDQAAHNLVLAGVPVIVAAGNDGTDACTKSPARDPLVTTVAATDADDQRLWLSSNVASNIGPCVDVWAPGANILSASTRSNIASDYRSGTSQAAPYVAGCIALYLENNTDSQPAQTRTALNSWAVPNIITEPTASSPMGLRYLNNTVNALLNIPKTSPLVLSPSNCTISSGFAAPCLINVSLTKVPSSDLIVDINLSDSNRGIVIPPALHFSPGNASQIQQVQLEYIDAALNGSNSHSFSLNFVISSRDRAFNGFKSKSWVFDQKGDVFGYPKVIPQLPFQETGNTYFYDDNYNLACGYAAVPFGRDVVYYFQPVKDTSVTISLCGNSSEPFDTQLYLLADLSTASISAIACNDNHCGLQSLLQANLNANVAYGIVIDSRDGHFGTYSIAITDNQGLQIPALMPNASSLQHIDSLLPQAMLAASQQPSYVVSAVQNPPGQTGPTPNPAPPLVTVVGTIPGPDVSTAFPALVNLSDYSGPATTSPPSYAPPPASGSFSVANVFAPTRTAMPGGSAALIPPAQVSVSGTPGGAVLPNLSGGPLASSSVQNEP